MTVISVLVCFAISGKKKNPGHPLEKRGWGMPGIQKGWGLRGEQIWWEGRQQGWWGIRCLIWQGWEKIARDHWATGKLYRQNLARWTRHLGCESALYRAMTAVDICVSRQEAHRALVHIFCDSNKGWAGCDWESRVPLHRQVFRAITQRERGGWQYDFGEETRPSPWRVTGSQFEPPKQSWQPYLSKEGISVLLEWQPALLRALSTASPPPQERTGLTPSVNSPIPLYLFSSLGRKIICFAVSPHPAAASIDFCSCLCKLI